MHSAKPNLTPEGHRLLAAELKAMQDENERLQRRLDRAENFIAGSGAFELYQAYIKTSAA